MTGGAGVGVGIGVALESELAPVLESELVSASELVAELAPQLGQQQQ